MTATTATQFIGKFFVIKLNGQPVVGKMTGWNESIDTPTLELLEGPRAGQIVSRKVRSDAFDTAEAAKASINRTDVVQSSARVETVSDRGEEVVCTAQVRTFSINTRFRFLEHMVDMVATGPSYAMMITGDGGLGKSTTVMNQLFANGLKEGVDYTVIKGFSTAKALFRQMYEFRDRLIVLDDCDSVLVQAVNLIKSAIDDKPVRVVSWLTERSSEDLPNQFEFTGKLIFITNTPADKIDGAIRSRCLFVDVSMTLDEKLERIKTIMHKPTVKPEVSADQKEEVLAFLTEHKQAVRHLTMRTFAQLCDIRVRQAAVWTSLGYYQITNN